MTLPPASISVLAWLRGVIFTGPAEVGNTWGSAAALASDVARREIKTAKTTCRIRFILTSPLSHSSIPTPFGVSMYDHLPLFFLFLHLSPFGFGLLDDLLLQLPRDHVVVVHFHVEAAAPLRHRCQLHAIRQHLGHGHFRLHHRVARFVVHALDAPAAAVEIAHD